MLPANAPLPRPGLSARVYPVSVAAGEPLTAALEALCARHAVALGRFVLQGALSDAVIVAAPGATPLALNGPCFLVSASAQVSAGPLALFGTVSWVEQGCFPRVAAGRLLDAQSAGVAGELLAFESAGVASAGADVVAPRPVVAPAPPGAVAPARAQRSRAAETRKGGAAPLNRGSEPALAPPDASDEVDLTAELAAIGAHAPPIAASTAGSNGGWAAAVAASRSAPAAPPRLSPARGGGAAQPQRSGPPTPDELGFDELPPDLSPGDILLHPKFGRCRVVQARVADKVKVRRATGGMFDLQLSVFRFARQPDEAGGRVFRLRVER